MPIFVAITGMNYGSKNPKIGRMAQAWIVTKEDPRIATKAGREASVCGDCKLRPSKGGGCYVSQRWGPGQIWHTRYVFNSYPQARPQHFRHRLVRFGAWGDPSAVPLEAWRPILDNARGWTGYTHQWRNLDPADWGWLMASVDNEAEHVQAAEAGWRTFRVRAPGDELGADEVPCPAADETRARPVSCASCRLCDGYGPAFRNLQTKNVSIVAHGRSAKRAIVAGRTR